jgi:hypothetical protein
VRTFAAIMWLFAACFRIPHAAEEVVVATSSTSTGTRWPLVTLPGNCELCGSTLHLGELRDVAEGTMATHAEFWFCWNPPNYGVSFYVCQIICCSLHQHACGVLSLSCHLGVDQVCHPRLQGTLAERVRRWSKPRQCKGARFKSRTMVPSVFF